MVRDMNAKRLLTLYSILLSSSICLAQSAGPGCGDPKINFAVHTSKSQTPVVVPPGKALVYFFQDVIGLDQSFQLTTRVGVDGRWVGADHGRSFFAVPLPPGEHDLCTSWQGWQLTPQSRTAAVHLTAEPGKTY
jgi:hypothetical protein